MKTSKIIGIGAACFVVVITIAIITTNSLGGLIENQQERNYQRFVSNVDGLTNTFRQSVEACAELDQIQQKQCMEEVIEEFQIQFGTLIKLFGYEPHIEELYYLWKADLDFWFDSTKVQLQYSNNPEFIQSEIQRLSDIRQKAIDSRLKPSFAQQVESGQ
ncbi:MAG: hypothetical protein GTN35_02015 [Nitrososphaeria archaeon]|nr:hypothetical protein [Nitrosopumilaceae archaeon]NIP09298.1 hypothetical protein [Nitrosopumilaceae archaeon]NIP91171.1 hypothetical protein [Nitrososphaeria archaeon]NIS94465.1 hypothetical protein [Nitrosopumilaceae archaeon]